MLFIKLMKLAQMHLLRKMNQSTSLLFFMRYRTRNLTIQFPYYNSFIYMTQEYKTNNFISKFYSLLKNKNFEQIIKFDEPNSKIVIFDKEKLEIEILPFFFRHNKFTSFIRQLNLYGFKKIKTSPNLTFTHPTLLKGQRFQSIVAKKKETISEHELIQRNANIETYERGPQFSNYNQTPYQVQAQHNIQSFFNQVLPSQLNNSTSLPQNSTSLYNFSYLMPLSSQNNQMQTFFLPFQQTFDSNGSTSYFRPSF